MHNLWSKYTARKVEVLASLYRKDKIANHIIGIDIPAKVSQFERCKERGIELRSRPMVASVPNPVIQHSLRAAVCDFFYGAFIFFLHIREPFT